MKKIISILILTGLCSSVFASEISSLYKEFQRRDAINLTKEQKQVIQYLGSLKYDVQTIKNLDLFDSNDASRFVFEAKNGDVCFGDLSVDQLRCKNSMGITTLNHVGDSD